MEKPHSHRPTQKQQNKGFKSRHATKGSLKDKTKGKVERTSVRSVKQRQASTKADRRNAAKMLQMKKREEVVKTNRLFDGRRGAPKIVTIVPLCPDVSPASIVESMLRSLDLSPEHTPISAVTTLSCDRLKQRIQFVQPSIGGDRETREKDLMDILDAVKVTDFVMFVVSAKEEVDAAGEAVLSAIMAQGVPSVFSVVQHLEEVPAKKRNEVKKSLLSFMSHFFPEEEKVHPIDTKADVLAVLRMIASQTPKSVAWRENRAYLLADKVEFDANEEDSTRGTLKVTGYTRGAYFNANRLVHLQDFGDFQVSHITSCPVVKNHNGDGNEMSIDVQNDTAMDFQPEITILHAPTADKQDDLISENDPDPLANEQTWPTEEELAEADGKLKSDSEPTRKVRVPKGTSSYQAAWATIGESGDEDDSNADEEDDAMFDDDDEVMDDGPGNKIELEGEDGEEYEDVELESKTVSFAQPEELSLEEEERQLQEYYTSRKAEHKDAMMFPDEIDTPMNIPARTRFQRYRGLQSFRTSPWDPYENLPVDYSKIFQFDNYRRTRDRMMRNFSEEGVAPGVRVTIHIVNVPRAFMDTYTSSRVVEVFQLHEHEHKMSVLNFSVIRPTPEADEVPEIVKSKDRMILHCGFRRYRVHPIYSANTRHTGTKNSGKANKFERFLKPAKASIATVFAPVQISTAPVALYKEVAMRHAPKLIATGTFLDVEPRRIIAKRIILTGAPFKVHKKTATVRYMFFQPEDVLWFKPIQLTTKNGRTGHIRESLGTHGYMKCMFDGPVSQQDTVCMNLYKRVFPKWNTELYRRPEVAKALENGDTEMLL